jgi:hypothetical protein
MKKTLSLALTALLILGLAACGGGSRSSAAGDYGYYESNDAVAEMEMPAGTPAPSLANGSATPSDIAPGGEVIQADKIIYSASAGIETKDYDKTIDDVYAMIEDSGGFLESSSIGGTSYSSTRGRRAEFVLRVPSDKFAQLTESLSTLGNVTYCRTYTENVTPQYIDVEARLESYRIQEERLLAMLEKAERLEDMLTIEAHLADVRYNIETYTSQLKYLDRQVAYSTVTLSVEEVVEFSPDTSVNQSFLRRMGNAFSGSLSDVVALAQGLVLALLSGWYLIVIVVLIVLIVRRIVRHRRKKREEQQL